MPVAGIARASGARHVLTKSASERPAATIKTKKTTKKKKKKIKKKTSDKPGTFQEPGIS